MRFLPPPPVYWRLYRCDDGRIRPVCMQDFDEYDYHQDRFLNADRYESEALAEAALTQEIGQALRLLRGY